MYNRWCKRRTCEMSDTSSHSNERYLNTPGKKVKQNHKLISIRPLLNHIKKAYPEGSFAAKSSLWVTGKRFAHATRE